MSSLIGLLVLFLATLTLGGCAGMPYGVDPGMSGYGYGGSYAQPYGGVMPMPVPMNPGYGGPAVVYAPQPYYNAEPYSYYNGSPGYAPAPGVAAGPWVDHRERGEGARLRHGFREGSLTPREAQRLEAEQRHRRGPEARMHPDGNHSPYERSRPDAMQNRTGQNIYRGGHNGVSQPGLAGPQPGRGPAGHVSSVGQPQSNGAQRHGPIQPGAAPRGGRVAETQGQ